VSCAWNAEGRDIIDAFKNAAVETGIPETDDFNCGNNEGVSRKPQKAVRWRWRRFSDPVRRPTWKW
jgi:hypothetical protein